MVRYTCPFVALAGLFLCCSATPAQVSVRAPFVRVDVGPPGGGVHVRAPFVNVNVPPRYYSPPVAAYPVQQVPVQPAPYVPRFEPQVPPVGQPFPGQYPQAEIPVPRVLPSSGTSTVLVKSRPMTHREFANAFVPVPGRYEVDLIHPGCCDNVVHVCFDLPPGCPRVHVGNRYIEYDYGNYSVEIRFALFGKVRVEYND
jgi:hypothetical protein